MKNPFLWALTILTLIVVWDFHFELIPFFESLSMDSVTIVDRQLDLVRQDLVQEIKITRKDVLSSLDTVANKADNRLGLIQKDTFKRIDKVSVNLDNQLTKSNSSLENLTKAYADVPNKISKNLNPYFDCEENALCLQGQSTDLLFAVRKATRDFSKMSGEIEKVVPDISKNVEISTQAFAKGFPRILDNTDRVTGNIANLTRTRWYDRVITGAISGAIVYGNVKK